MPYIRTTVTIDRTPLLNIENRVRAAPGLLATAQRREVGRIAADFIAEIATPLRDHQRPTLWQSPKQRRWWFAVGIHQWQDRTGALERGWKRTIDIDDAGGLFSVYNTQPYKIFVQGIYQQRMHRGTWANEDQTVQKYRIIAQGRLIATWRVVFDPFANVPQG